MGNIVAETYVSGAYPGNAGSLRSKPARLREVHTSALQARKDAIPDTGTEVRQSVLTQVLDCFTARARALDEMGNVARGGIMGMANDFGVTEADLRELLPGGADNTRLMDAMMRDLELTCTCCGAAVRCRREPAAGTAAVHCDEFCGNADTLDVLLESRGKAWAREHGRYSGRD